MKNATGRSLLPQWISTLRCISVGQEEYYIDVAMPFGKANSSKHFCAWTELWFSSFLVHFRRAVPFHAVLGSYVDDGFRGAQTLAHAKIMIDYLYVVSHATGTVFNIVKIRGSTTRLVILDLLYCSVNRSYSVSDKKRDKYLTRISRLLLAPTSTSKHLEQYVGNLGYAA